MQTSRRRGRRMAGPTSVEEFDLVTPFSGGAALEEAAAWEAKQMEAAAAARHAKELRLLAEVERLSAARAKGKKGKKKKKNVGVGDTGAARLSTRRCCAVRELVASSILMRVIAPDLHC